MEFAPHSWRAWLTCANARPEKDAHWPQKGAVHELHTGLKEAYDRLGAKRRDQYSWVARLGDGYVLSAEVDHKKPENTLYNHRGGEFFKRLPPMSRDNGHEPLSISHSIELFEAASRAYSQYFECRILLLKGTKFGTEKGPIRAAPDGHFWKIVEVSGSVEEGYFFRAERIR